MSKEWYSRVKEWFMSFFIGKDNNDRAVIHITSDTVSESVIKSGEISSTIFHSDLQYLGFEVFEPSEVYTKNPTSRSGKTTPGGKMCSFTDDFYLKFSGNSRRMFFMSVAGESYMTPILTGTYIRNFVYTVHWYSTANPDFSTSDGVYNSLDYPTSTYKYAFIMTSSTDIKAVLSNYSDGNFIVPPTSGNDIYLDKNEMLVNGVDLREYRYICSGTINSIDDTTNINGNTYQLINSTPKSGSMSISSNGSSTGEISIGGAAIFKESSSQVKLTAGRRYASTLRWAPGTRTAILLSGVTDGALVLVKVKRVFVGVASSPSYIRTIFSATAGSSLRVKGPSSTLNAYIQADSAGNLIFKVTNSQSWTYDWDVEVDEFA